MRSVTYEDKQGNVVVGTFHGFFQDHEEYETGPGNYPVAIIENLDGTVSLIYPLAIKFVSPSNSHTPGFVGATKERTT